MDKIVLSVKDKRILSALDKDANLSLSSLARKVGLSRQVIEYRLKKLHEQHTIYAFYTIVDVGKLGYSSFRVHMRLKNVNQERCVKFAEELFVNYPTFWVGFVSGSFDIIIDIFAKNSNEFENIILDIVKKNKEIVQSYDTLVMLALNLYKYGYFYELEKNREEIKVHRNNPECNLNTIDEKILVAMKVNSRLSYEEIARKIGLTRNAVKERIKKLESKGVIEDYMMVVNFNHFDKQSFKIFVKYNNSKIEQEKELFEEIRQTPGILNTVKLLGKWDLDIEIHRDNIRDLQQFIIGLRNKYDLIENYEVIQIIDDYGIDFYPEKLAEAKK